MLARTKVSFREGFLVRSKPQSTGKADGVVDVEFLLLCRRLLIFENQSHKFVVLVEKDVKFVTFMLFVRIHVLDNFDLCGCPILSRECFYRWHPFELVVFLRLDRSERLCYLLVG